MSFKKLLVAIDSSEISKKCMDAALTLNSACGDAPIVLVHVLQGIPDLIGNFRIEMVIPDMVDLAEQTLAKGKSYLEGKHATVTAKLLKGYAASEIIETAEKEGCDLIIMGARGHGGMSGLLLGSVTQKVLQHAGVSVLIAR